MRTLIPSSCVALSTLTKRTIFIRTTPKRSGASIAFGGMAHWEIKKQKETQKMNKVKKNQSGLGRTWTSGVWIIQKHRSCSNR